MSSSALGQHAKMHCSVCGIQVRAKDPALWLQGSGASARAYHFDCKLKSLRQGLTP